VIVGMHATKVIVRDVEAAERFYRAIGLKLVNRNTGGKGDESQKQSWLSVTGDSASHMLILSEFVEIHAPALPGYPRKFWLALNVADVEKTLAEVEAAGGRVRLPGEDQPAHGVRAAVVEDNEGHVIEIVGPICGKAGVVADPLATAQGAS
jgi:catechol 2,3-dioxygenase-like lactoylglutathione lyase family enzyme